MAKENGATPSAGGLGTFGGVFVPNVLTILGVIMFLRTGWVVGQAGLLWALVILLTAKTITALTALSLSAISTNTKVGSGGAYFLISRSLGLEVGGAIGVPLYFAQAISVAFYLVGFSESLHLLLPEADPRLVSSIALGAFVVVAWFGAGIVTKAQYLILAMLLASLVSIFAGVRIVEGSGTRIVADYSEGQGFWTVFAIFFPAVTGIMAGVSMSGDLRDPAKSIPRGTIGAVLVTLVIYAAVIVAFALGVDRTALKEDNLVLLDLARVPALVYVGLWAATLSSALASLAAAPRTLQALAYDRVMPRFLAQGFSGEGRREPHVALLITAVVAAMCVLAGDLDLIAPIITMFFLATYGTVNLVAGIERLVSNPSYRPTFRTHWTASLAGGLGCLAVMLLINVPATLAAMVVIAAIYGLLTRRRLDTVWGDMRSGLWFSLTRFGLLRYMSSRQHIRNWRPVILVLVGSPRARLGMLRFAHSLEARRGFLFLAQIVTGPWDELMPRQRSLEEALRGFISDHGLSAVPKAVIADDFEHGVSTLLQVTGIGQFQPNTIMVGWSDDELRGAAFGRSIRRILEFERNLVVYREAAETATLERTIDVWWYAKANGSFMLTLAFLLQANPEWGDTRIRVLRIIRDEAGAEDARAGTEAVVRERRVNANVEVIVAQEPPMEVIGRVSQRAAVCFVGMSLSASEEGSPLDPYAPLVERLHGNLFITKSWQDLQY